MASQTRNVEGFPLFSRWIFNRGNQISREEKSHFTRQVEVLQRFDFLWLSELSITFNDRCWLCCFCSRCFFAFFLTERSKKSEKAKIDTRYKTGAVERAPGGTPLRCLTIQAKIVAKIKTPESAHKRQCCGIESLWTASAQIDSEESGRRGAKITEQWVGGS